MAIDMALFGTVLPFLFAFISAKWLASKLQLWWGSIISVVISCLLGVVIPLAIYVGISEITELKFEGGFFVRALANALIMCAFASIWSVMRTRKAIARNGL
jgi:hypothetical protein